MDILKLHERQVKFFEAASYDSMTEEAIKREHRHLRRTLQSINAQLAVMLDEVQAKPFPQP
jgi:flagellin-specific chaperone FliS